MSENMIVLAIVAGIFAVAPVIVALADFFRGKEMPEPLGFVVPFTCMGLVVCWAGNQPGVFG